MAFRRGLIDTSWHGARDAKLLPGGRLAVLTYGGGCPDRPQRISGAGSHVTVVYAADSTDQPCTNELAPYTAIFALPAGVNGALPLDVRVQTASDDAYVMTAR